MRAGTRTRSEGVTISCSRSTAGGLRLGLAVRARNSVVRNRIRRRLKEAFRAAQGAGSYDVVVRADEGSLHLRFQELVEIASRALEGCDERCV